MRAYARCVKINRLKRETVDLTGQDFGLCLCMRVRLRVRSKLEGEQCVSLHVC